jgi:5-methylcytosine-specific restriction protein B
MILTMSDDPVPEIAAYLDIVSGPNGDPGDNPVYTLLECAEETGFNVSILEKWVTAINRKGQGVFYGPPGTGKTYIAERIAKHLIGGNDGYAELLQFHPAYAYEDFMQGLRPQKTDSGGFDYELVPGRFFEFCREARSRKGPCVLIIDEINRANLARVFGELMYLLEYRGKEVPLAMGKTFRIPPNVRLIGTMNTADRSIAVVDHALRRRFAFIPLHPNYDLLQDKLVDSDIDGSALTVVLKKLNTKIADPNYSIGISFFLAEDIDDHIESIWQMEIEPYLEEYFVDKPGVVDEFRWDRVSKDIGIEGE